MLAFQTRIRRSNGSRELTGSETIASFIFPSSLAKENSYSLNILFVFGAEIAMLARTSGIALGNKGNQRTKESTLVLVL